MAAEKFCQATCPGDDYLDSDIAVAKACSQILNSLATCLPAQSDESNLICKAITLGKSRIYQTEDYRIERKARAKKITTDEEKSRRYRGEKERDQ